MSATSARTNAQRLLRLLGRRDLAGADRPDRLVGDHDLGQPLARRPSRGPPGPGGAACARSPRASRSASVSPTQRIGSEARRRARPGPSLRAPRRSRRTARAARSGRARRRATSSSVEHRRRDLAGEGALGRSCMFWAKTCDARAARRVDHAPQRGERRADRDVDALGGRRRAAAAPAMNTSASATVLCIFQLPAIERCARLISSGPPRRGASCPRSARATRRRPSRDGSTRSARPNCASAAALSPPPTTVVPAQSATASATARVPPRTARARRRPSARSRRRVPGAAIALGVALRRCAGRCRGPSSRRARRRRRARGARRRRRSASPSTRSTGSSRPCRVGRVGEHARARARRPPPRTASRRPRGPARAGTESTSRRRSGPRRRGSRKASSTPILSVTLAPPRIATSGRGGSSRMPLSVSTSRSQQAPGGARQQRARRRRSRRARGARRRTRR